MSTILVPTDFSSGAKGALKYAVALAKKENAKILLLHAFYISYSISEYSGLEIAETMESIREDVDKKLKSLCTEIIEPEKIKFEYVIRQGLTVDVIIDEEKKVRPDFIVLGTNGASGLKKVFIGSNAATVIEKAKCPVIAVPAHASFKGINKITYATDYHESDIHALKEMVKLAKLFHAKITVLHASDEELAHYAEEIGIERFENLVRSKIKYNKMTFRVLYGKYLEDILRNHIKEESTDLLAMSTGARTFVEKLFGTSSTKQMAYQTNIPLIAFHHKSNSLVLI